MEAATMLGLGAAFCTTLAFLPQALHAWRTRSTKDISLGMFALMVLGVAPLAGLRAAQGRSAADHLQQHHAPAGGLHPDPQAETWLSSRKRRAPLEDAPGF